MTMPSKSNKRRSLEALWVGSEQADFVGSPSVAGHIGQDGHLTLCKPTWYLIPKPPAGSQIINCNMSAYIEYTLFGFSCKTKTVSWSGAGQGDAVTGVFNFGADVLGGDLVCSITNVDWHDPTDGKIKRANDKTLRWSVLGTNPSKRDIKAALGNTQLQVVAFLESTFRQFGPDGLPLRGPSSLSTGGFGVMQLDSPRPSCRQLFNWKDNIQAGVVLYNQKKATVARHFENERKGHPERRALTDDELRRALYAYYNSGFYYYEWSDDEKEWVPGSLTAYADGAMKLEEAVLAGNPPSGWD